MGQRSMERGANGPMEGGADGPMGAHPVSAIERMVLEDRGIGVSHAEEGEKKTNEEESSGGQFLVGFRGHLFDIQSDYQAQEALDGYDAVGAGLEVAIGSLYTSCPTQEVMIEPRRRVAMALEAAQHHNAGVRGPFYVEVLEVPV